MKRLKFSQQEIVFAVFALLFLLFSIFLPGFLTPENMLTLLQNVAVLGILGLAMAIVVIGRGIDISLIAALAVPPGLVLQMVQNGHSLPASLVVAFLLAIAFGLVNGWLIAYAEVPSLFATLATGLLLAGLGQAALFRLDVVQWRAGPKACPPRHQPVSGALERAVIRQIATREVGVEMLAVIAQTEVGEALEESFQCHGGL